MLVSKEFHDVSVLANLFNNKFAKYHVILQPGADEPFYQAETNGHKAIIYSREDFFASALHELAHWCIAGMDRRTQDDYGYWYEADGRSAQLQQLFFKVEVKPQALEWAFALASNFPFRVSVDNLNNPHSDMAYFKDKVYQQLARYFEEGFSVRALAIIQMLSCHYRQGHPIRLPEKESCLI